MATISSYIIDAFLSNDEVMHLCIVHLLRDYTKQTGGITGGVLAIELVLLQELIVRIRRLPASGTELPLLHIDVSSFLKAFFCTPESNRNDNIYEICILKLI